MKSLIIALLLLLELHAEDTVKKVVFDLTTGDIKVFEKKILSGIANFKAYYQGNFEELEVSVVIHGQAYKFFIENLSNTMYKDESALNTKQKDLAKRLKAMVELYEVEFLICEIGMRKLKIQVSDLYKYVKLVPNSTIGLIDKQSEGYSYIPVSK